MFNPGQQGSPFMPKDQGRPFGNPFGNIGFTPPPPPTDISDPRRASQLPRFLNYVADYGGCGFWRCMWPEYLLNADGRCVVQT